MGTMKDCIARVVRRHLSLKPMVFRLAGCLLLCLAIGSAAQAGTAITETTGAGNLGTQVLPPSGNVYGITGGKPVGNNLYHSFAQFSVGTGDVAQFQTSTLSPNSAMSNILARVTGGNPSSIFGTVDSISYYPNANLFLMNPNGILFGLGAQVNVGGMAHFTTADYLRLDEVGGPNAGIFHADVTQSSVLTNAPIAAFGFLGSNPAAISVQGSQLTMAKGTGLSLVGGNRGFNYIDPDTGNLASAPDGVTVTGGRLSAPNGEINLAITASPGEFLVAGLQSAPNTNLESFVSFGSVHLAPSSTIDAPGTSTVSIRGGQFVLAVNNAVLTTAKGPSVPNSITLSQGSSIVTSNTGPEPGADVQIHTGNFQMNGASILADSTGAGRAGDIEINAANLNMSEFSLLQTASSGSGKAGDIRLAVSGDVSLTGAGDIGISGVIVSDSTGSGSGGSITITSSSMTVTDLGMVMTRAFGTNRAGDITIDTTTLNVVGGGVVQTRGHNDLAPSGNISIRATDSMTLASSGSGEVTILNENHAGGTGTISIEAGRLELRDQGRIFSNTSFDSDPAAANQAKISVTADSITLSNGSGIDVGGFYSDTGRLDLSAQNLTMSGVSSITALSNAGGASGPILINVQDLAVSEGSQILSYSLGFGRGGDVTVNATGSILLTGQGPDPLGGTLSGILSNTFGGFEDPSLTGNAGNISITGHSIEVSNGARVDSSSGSFVLGNAGNIDLTAPTITLNGGTIATSTAGAGAGGSITIGAGQSVTLNNGSSISASSTGAGNAGNILINAGQNYTSTNSAVTTQAAQASGGTIKITTAQNGTVQLTNSLISASVLDGAGGGGSVNIDPQFVILLNSKILANAVQGPGGNISITTNLLLPDANSVISASSKFGLNGTVTIQSPNAPGAGEIQPLGKTPLLATSLLNQRCASLAGGEFSSFTVAGRDSLPTEPGSWLASPFALATLSEGMGTGEGLSGLSGLSSLSGVSGVVRGGLAAHQIDQIDQTDQYLLSLRQIAPVGFLTQSFAVDEPTGCQSS